MVLARRVLFIVLFAMVLNRSHGQTFNSKGDKLFSTVSDTLALDSLSLVPGSVKVITFPADPGLQPEVNYQQHALIFKGRKPDSLRVSYRRFPYNFERTFFHKDPSILYKDLSRRSNPFEIRYNNSSSSGLLENDGLQKNGNISRGITFGNNQDVVVNSNLNLQVSGKLSDEIDILMAATDNNIPFQADGTTAQLQEFDKVFVQLNNQTSKLVVGDYQLSRPQSSYFMNFYKRAQGFYFENNYKDSTSKKPLMFKTQLAGAVSKGKFSRMVFFGTENNQGPYRLRGADNEPFIIVLSGTEKIYIDGKLLQRGQENDYIIDYNTGELTFTARQMITKDKRIVAEFQYAERNYARSLFFFGEELSTRKSNFYVNVFSEQDNRNRSLQQSLDTAQKRVMREAGDSLNRAYFTGATIEEFNIRTVFYSKRDTVVGSFVYPDVYVYTPVADSINYSLKFSFVGANRGNYVKASTAANGQVFNWVAPLDDVPQGSYEPVIPLVTPKTSQMLVAGFTHSFDPRHVLNMEGVYTRNDINTFSGKDKRNDEGSGVKFLSKNFQDLKKDSTGHDLKLVYNVHYEFLQQRFKQVERFRSIEFDRDWNRPLTGHLLNDQHLGGLELGLLRSNRASLTYGYNMFTEGNTYDGKKHLLGGSYQLKRSYAQYNGSYLTTNDAALGQNTVFYRHKTLLWHKIEKLKFSYSDEFENNQFRNSLDNTKLLPRAYQFWEWEGSISNADSSRNNIKAFYRRRMDKLNYGNELKDSTHAENIGLQASFYSLKNNPLTLLVTYRKLDLINVVNRNSLKPDNTLLNRLEYNPRYFKGLVTASVFYETGYGLENKRDYYYLEVAPGQGQFAWNDYNENGIRERSEFEVALFTDQQRFIRIYTPTNDYLKVLQNQLSLSFTLRPSNVLRNSKKKMQTFLNRWALQTALRYDNKVSDRSKLEDYNPFVVVVDTLLLASNNNVRHSLFFNQSSAIFGADYTYTRNQGKQLLTNGFEERSLLSQQLRWRLNFYKAWSINSDNILSTKTSFNQFFAERNYSIDGISSEQRLIFQPSTVFRISGIFKYEDKHNTLKEQGERARLDSYGLELKLNQTERGSLSGRADLIMITYTGIENSAVAYEMLNGLNKGQNFTWELSYQRNLSSNIQVSINYNGRKSPAAPVVHIGGAQVRAFF